MSEIKSSGRPFDQLLEKVLCMNILASEYFRDLLKLKTYHEVIDEIYVTVTHVEPWMTGNCRGPSTAFCLLYKFFIMKLTVKQMHGLLNHSDSPYIRAIGFLYLRYVADPKTLWNWCEPFLKDDENGNIGNTESIQPTTLHVGVVVVGEFSPGSNGRMTTMGVYVRDLLLGQYYFDTLFPRIPVLVLRTVVSNLESMKLPSKHCGVTGETTRGCDETARRPPSVKAALSVSFGQRAPHRTSTRDSSPVRRTVTHSYDKDSESRQSPNHPGSQNGDLSGRDYSGRDRGRERERDRGKDGNSDREKTRDRYGDRDGERGRELERGKERRYHYDKRSRDTYRRNYDRKGRDEHYRRGGSSRQSRSRSRSRSRSQSQSIHEHSKHNSPFSHECKEKIPASSNLAKLKDLYGVLSNQKDGVAENEGRTRSSGTEEVIRLGGSSWR